jgi:hypothetical protein
MISHITPAFRTMFGQLPAQVQQQAREAYTLFLQNPWHPSLRWKRVHPTRPIYSVRVGRGTVPSAYARQMRWSGFGLGRMQRMTSC